MKLTIFLSTLLVIPLFAEHQINLYPVYNKLKQRTGYALNVNIGKPGKEFRVLLDTLTSLLWVPGTDRMYVSVFRFFFLFPFIYLEVNNFFSTYKNKLLLFFFK
ncbi:unnamed protein product [Brugia pahangi]|uniref:Peptidase A1 domain-containing protein n=1 Tax=Brugia pahangi TaxID=6280 RepID=A0A0N4T638_BRUPA|nr:unnamed protein product [Brugia pahangi]